VMMVDSGSITGAGDRAVDVFLTSESGNQTGSRLGKANVSESSSSPSGP
jgi:hypothetical protein